MNRAAPLLFQARGLEKAYRGRQVVKGASLAVQAGEIVALFGANGAGVVSKLGLGDRVLVQMGTLGKALGGFGAYVAGSQALRDLLINRCRSFIFTTSLPPAIMAMAMAAIDLVEGEPERREALWNNCHLLSDGLKKIGFLAAPPFSMLSVSKTI